VPSSLHISLRQRLEQLGSVSGMGEEMEGYLLKDTNLRIKADPSFFCPLSKRYGHAIFASVSSCGATP
jgi:hypothetical protein